MSLNYHRFTAILAANAEGKNVAANSFVMIEQGEEMPASIYEDKAGELPIHQPSRTDSNGNFEFYAEAGEYLIIGEESRQKIVLGGGASGGNNNPAPTIGDSTFYFSGRRTFYISANMQGHTAHHVGRGSTPVVIHSLTQFASGGFVTIVNPTQYKTPITFQNGDMAYVFTDTGGFSASKVVIKSGGYAKVRNADNQQWQFMGVGVIKG